MKYIALFLVLISSAYAKITPDTARAFKIAVKSKQGTKLGTGFVVRGKSGKHYVMTNEHECFGSTTGFAGVQDPDDFNFYTAKIVAKDRSKDLCIIECPEHLKQYEIPLAESNTPTDVLYSVGFPGGMGPFVSFGELGGLRTLPIEGRDIYTFYDITVRSYPGSSGSPVLSPNGEVVGVVFLTNYQNYGSMLRLDEIKDFMRGR